MRSTIVLISLLLLPVLVIAHLWIYDEDMKPALANHALGELKRIGIKHSKVTLDYLDVKISGVAASVEMRDEAGAAMHEITGLHFLDRNNLIVVPATVTSQLEDGRIVLSGWLPSQKDVDAVIRIISEFRPDLALDAKRLRISKIVTAATEAGVEITASHRLLKPMLASLRVPAAFSVEKSGDVYVLNGALPSAELKNAVIEAVQDNPAGWKIDATGLIGAPHVMEAAFTRQGALPLFLHSYFSAPTPGSFVIQPDGSPRLVADATRQMEAEWMGLLRQVSGAAKVDAELTIYPSVYQLPGYQCESQVEPSTLEPLMNELSRWALVFDPVTNTISEEEEAKLEAIAPLITACGPGLRLILSSTDGPARDIPAARKARCETVKTKLAALGVPAGQMEVEDLGALHPERALPANAEPQTGARVEMLVK